MGRLEDTDTSQIDAKTLAMVFGESSKGATLEERAQTSENKYVRSQVQLAFLSKRATGRVLTAFEALSSYGYDVLKTVAEDGACPIVTDYEEPSRTISSRRQELNLDVDRVARAAGLSRGQLIKMETAGELSPIRDLEKVAQVLALDERALCYQPKARGDADLGVRLRELAKDWGVLSFSAATVLHLSEAAWVVERQSYLMDRLSGQDRILDKFPPNTRYAFPAYRIGYDLAAKARDILGIDEIEPIESLRSLMEEVLGIPLIQQKMDRRFAGATIANGKYRGVVVNEQGMNENVWVRRMTLCHELGHLLWDPDNKLNKIIVDSYESLDHGLNGQRDPVEIRANAFAIAFLAPPPAVKRIVNEGGSAQSMIACLMQRYGISATAAKWHIGNIGNVDCSGVNIKGFPMPTDDWVARENMGVDYFPIKKTPISRRGKFAFFVCKAVRNKIISADSAAMYFQTDVKSFEEYIDMILSLYGDKIDAMMHPELLDISFEIGQG